MSIIYPLIIRGAIYVIIWFSLYVRYVIINIFTNTYWRGVTNMKKLEIIIQPEKLEDLKMILTESNAQGIMITNIMGYGKQKGYVQVYRGTKTNVNLLPKIKVETVVLPEVAEVIIERVTKEISTGNYGDGKIFIYEMEDAVRIRTGERGSNALQ